MKKKHTRSGGRRSVPIITYFLKICSHNGSFYKFCNVLERDFIMCTTYYMVGVPFTFFNLNRILLNLSQNLLTLGCVFSTKEQWDYLLQFTCQTLWHKIPLSVWVRDTQFLVVPPCITQVYSVSEISKDLRSTLNHCGDPL